MKLNIYLSLLLIICLGLSHEVFSKSLFLIKNYGVSFGINTPFILFLSIFLLLFFFVLMIKNGSGFILIFSGGLLNFVDRLRWGYVRDYWNFFDSGIYNNINDWIIGIGVLFFLINFLWQKQK